MQLGAKLRVVIGLGAIATLVAAIALFMTGYHLRAYYLILYNFSGNVEQKSTAVRHLLVLSPSLGIERAGELFTLLNAEYSKSGKLPSGITIAPPTIFSYFDSMVDLDLCTEETVQAICDRVNAVDDDGAGVCICILSSLALRFSRAEVCLGVLVLEGRSSFVRTAAAVAVGRRPVGSRAAVDAIFRAMLQGEGGVCRELKDSLFQHLFEESEADPVPSRENGLRGYVVERLLTAAEEAITRADDLDAECGWILLSLLRPICRGNEKALEVLILAARSGSAELRGNVVHIFVSVLEWGGAWEGKEKVVAALKELSKDPDEVVRQRAAFALSEAEARDAVERQQQKRKPSTGGLK